MTNGLFILAWAALACTAPPALDIIHGLADARPLPDFFLQPKGRKYARLLARLLAACALALLAWGLMHVGWQKFLVDAFAGLLGSMVLAQMIQSAWRLYAGGVVTVLLTVYLWSSAA